MLVQAEVSQVHTLFRADAGENLRRSDLSAIVAEWQMVNPIEVVTDDFRQGVIDQFILFHNLENDDTGTKLGHNILTDGVYSRRNLPAITAVHQWAQLTGDLEAETSAAIALFTLREALSTREQFTKRNGFNERGAFARMRSELLSGDQSWPTFLGLMNIARTAAATCLEMHGNKLPPDTQISLGKEKMAPFKDIADQALLEYRESQEGVNLGAEFTRRLLDPETEAVVISLDINSTLNTGESYATLPFLDSATAELQTLADHFQKVFPEKKLFIVLNTGRPALYVWGISDSLPPIPEARKIALAESGGVVIRFDGSQLLREVAVESPHAWQEQLDGIKSFILSQISDKNSVMIEPKDSMLSIRIAKRPENGGNYLHKTKEGDEVNEAWIRSQVTRYLMEQYSLLSISQEKILKNISEIPEADTIIRDAFSRTDISNERLVPPEVLQVLRDTLADAQLDSIREIQELQDAMETIGKMQEHLEAKFNATAGYVDIGHRNLNKYSTLSQAITNETGEKYNPRAVLTAHIGDSSTDIMPTEHTNKGEVNEGADQVFLICVENGSKSLYLATNSRGEHGKITSRPSVLGVRDVIRHIVNVVDAEGHRISDLRSEQLQ